MLDLVGGELESGVLGTLRLSSVAQVVADRISKAVYDGRLKPGERLFENRLADDLGVSRTPIREALRLLQAEGVVEAEPNRGTVIRTQSVQEVIDIYEAKAVLESHVVRKVAAERRPEVLAGMWDHLERFATIAEGDDIDQLAVENAFFHRLVLEAGANPTIQRLALSISPWPTSASPHIWYSQELKLRSVAHHRAVVEAVVAGSPDRAEAAMRDHLLTVRATMAQNLRQLAAKGEAPPY